MNKITTYLTKENIFIGLIISLTFLASSALIGNSLATMQKSELISVSGSAERLVKSDAGKWTFSVSRNSEVEAFGFTAKRMKDDIDNSIKYLVNRGVKKEEIRIMPLNSTKICANQQQESYTEGGKECSGSFSYILNQKIIVESINVNDIQDLSLNAAQSLLAMSAITIRTEQVEYFYNGLSGLRTELLAEAMVNAKERAEALAKSTGNNIGTVKSASQGVFQVTAKNSTDVSDYGSYDTNYIEKKVTAVVRASFSVK